MKLKLDQRADALYLTLRDQYSSHSEEIAPGIILDYDDEGRVVGIEMLYLSKRTQKEDLQSLVFESVLDKA